METKYIYVPSTIAFAIAMLADVIALGRAVVGNQPVIAPVLLTIALALIWDSRWLVLNHYSKS